MTVDNSPEDKLKNSEKSKRSIVQSTILLIVLFAVSKGISLIQTFLLADAFGVKDVYDAYVVAAQIPDYIVTLMGGGALGYAFIPIFGGLLAKNETDRAWKLASHIVNTIFVGAFLASLIAFLLAPYLIEVIAPTFSDDIATLATNLLRILLLGTLIFSVSGILSGVLHSHNHFLAPALAPIFNDIGILLGILLLLPRFGIYGMVFGTIIGAAAHLLIQIPALLRYRAHWYPELGLNDPLLRRVIRLMLPRLAGLGVFYLNMLLMTSIATRLGDGAASAISWGWRIMQIPETLIGTAMGIVIFPTLAALSELEDEVGKRNAMSGALKFILIATIPSSIGLLLIGHSLLSLLERGAFDASATNLVYGALSTFTLGLIVHSLLEIIARSFYADKDTLTPLWAALGGAAINFVLAIGLSGILLTEAPPISNVTYLPLANSLGILFEVIVLFLILRKRWHGLNEISLAMTAGKTLAASLVMGAVVFAVGQAFGMLGLEGGIIYTLAQLALQVGLGGLAFILVALLLGMDEIKEIFNLLFHRNKANVESVQIATP
jgi:putative peptidoglycan lipid II flippase